MQTHYLKHLQYACWSFIEYSLIDCQLSMWKMSKVEIVIDLLHVLNLFSQDSGALPTELHVQVPGKWVGVTVTLFPLPLKWFSP